MNQVFTSETHGDLSRKIEEFMENYDVYDYDNVTIVTEKVNGEKPDSYHWKATLMPKDAIQVAKDLLVENGYIGFFVSSDEIKAVATDTQRELTDEEVSSVVEFLSHNDLETGLCEGAISEAISEVCPDATDQDWDDEEDESDGIDLDSSAWDIVENNLTPDI